MTNQVGPTEEIAAFLTNHVTSSQFLLQSWWLLYAGVFCL